MLDLAVGVGYSLGSVIGNNYLAHIFIGGILYSLGGFYLPFLFFSLMDVLLILPCSIILPAESFSYGYTDDSDRDSDRKSLCNNYFN